MEERITIKEIEALANRADAADQYHLSLGLFLLAGLENDPRGWVVARPILVGLSKALRADLTVRFQEQIEQSKG